MTGRGIVCSLIFFTSLSSGAAEKVSVFQTGLAFNNPSHDARVNFEANLKNPELGRAWLSVAYTEGDPSDEMGLLGHSVEVKVPGLKLDAAKKEIVYQRVDGSSVVCAREVTKSLLKGTTYQESGDCGLKIKDATVHSDDGMVLHSRRGVEVSLEVASPGRGG